MHRQVPRRVTILLFLLLSHFLSFSPLHHLFTATHTHTLLLFSACPSSYTRKGSVYLTPGVGIPPVVRSGGGFATTRTSVQHVLNEEEKERAREHEHRFGTEETSTIQRMIRGMNGKRRFRRLSAAAG